MSAPRKSKAPTKAGKTAKARTRSAEPTKLLSGGNPQIAKDDGDAPGCIVLKAGETYDLKARRAAIGE